MNPLEMHQVRTLAAIGYVCVRWSLLEFILLHTVAALAEVPKDQAEIAFGGLDIQPRVNMAISLARHQKAPAPIIDKLVAIRKAIQADLSDKRNRVVHGVHLDPEAPDGVRLHMARWSGPKKTTEQTADEMQQIGLDIATQCDVAMEVFVAVGDWKFGGWNFGDHRSEAGDGQPR